MPGSYIVVLKDAAPGVNAVAGDLTARHGGTVRRTYQAALHGFAVAATEQQAAWGIDRIDQWNLPLDNSYTFPGGGRGGRKDRDRDLHPHRHKLKPAPGWAAPALRPT